MTAWPDAKRPGVPLNPERSGWHWLRTLDGVPYVARWWSGPMQVWGAPMTIQQAAEFRTYLGPCLPPAEVAAKVAAAVMAEREACAAVCGEVAKERWAAEKKRPVGEPLFLWLGGPDSECQRRIARQPAPSGADALAAMLAAARREGIEAALVACRTVAMAMATDHSADGPPAHSAVRLVEREIRALLPEGGGGDDR